MLTKLYVRTRNWGWRAMRVRPPSSTDLVVAGIAMLIIVAVWALGGNLSGLTRGYRRQQIGGTGG